MVSDIVGSSSNALRRCTVCSSVTFFQLFSFNYSCDTIKTGWKSWLTAANNCVRRGRSWEFNSSALLSGGYCAAADGRDGVSVGTSGQLEEVITYYLSLFQYKEITFTVTFLILLVINNTSWNAPSSTKWKLTGAFFNWANVMRGLS